VESDNQPGCGILIAQAIADAKINLDFLVAQVIGRRYSVVIGFESAEDAKKVASLIKKRRLANASEGRCPLRIVHDSPGQPCSPAILISRFHLEVRSHQLQRFGHFQKSCSRFPSG